MAEPDTILVSESTKLLIEDALDCTHVNDTTPRGFSRPVGVYRVDSLRNNGEQLTSVTRKGRHVEVNIADDRNIREAIVELKRIQEEFEERLVAAS